MMRRPAFADVVLAMLIALAVSAPLIAPFDPYDPAAAVLGDAYMPPSLWAADGETRYWLGTDGQGRDILSWLLFGLRQSLWIGVVAVAASVVIGTVLGLTAGYRGGAFDTVIMRISDIQAAVPSILMAMLLFAVTRPVLKPSEHELLVPWLIVAAIVFSDWVLYARAVRAAVLVEKNKEYVAAAEAIGAGRCRIVLFHILPNVTGPVIVVAALSLPMAIIAEATLSFLGVGLPAGQPSLGTMIARGQSDIYSGRWWTLVFPAGALLMLAMSVNAIGARWQRGPVG